VRTRVRSRRDVFPPQDLGRRRAYLQIVESHRDGAQVRQQVIATLGRFEQLQTSGQLERLVRSGARFAAKAMVLSAASSDEAAIKIAVRRIGPALVFERLWEETGCRTVITLLHHQRHERRRIVEHQLAHQLVRAFPHAQDIQQPPRLQLGHGLSADHAAIGDHAHARDREAAAQPVDHRDQRRHVGGVARPHFRAHRPPIAVDQHRKDHLPQIGTMILAVAVLAQRLAAGALEIQAGGVHEHQVKPREQVAPMHEQSLLHHVLQAARGERRAPVLVLLCQFLAQPRHRPIQMMQIQPVDAGNGVILAPAIGRTVRAAYKQPVQHREEHGALQRKTMLAVARQLRGKEIDYGAKTVMLAGRRYIVCRNRQEAEKDAAERASIVAALERQLAKGDKALIGNTGFRRYLKTISDEPFAIDADKIEEERKFDGIFVLRTNTDLNPLEAMLCYKQLWTVEQTFRTAKHLFSTRPIFHKLDETIRGHVFCSFLALVLKAALEERIAALGRSGSWPEIIADRCGPPLASFAHAGSDRLGRSTLTRPNHHIRPQSHGHRAKSVTRDRATSLSLHLKIP
jgi:hypothetical protein